MASERIDFDAWRIRVTPPLRVDPGFGITYRRNRAYLDFQVPADAPELGASAENLVLQIDGTSPPEICRGRQQGRVQAFSLPRSVLAEGLAGLEKYKAKRSGETLAPAKMAMLSLVEVVEAEDEPLNVRFEHPANIHRLWSYDDLTVSDQQVRVSVVAMEPVNTLWIPRPDQQLFEETGWRYRPATGSLIPRSRSK